MISFRFQILKLAVTPASNTAQTTKMTDRKLLVAYFGGGAKTGKLFCTVDPGTEDFKPPGDVA